MAKLLISAGADVNKALHEEGTPLFIASQQGHIEVVKLLLMAGADKSKALNSITALEAAEKRGHVSIVQLLQSSNGIHI